MIMSLDSKETESLAKITERFVCSFDLTCYSTVGLACYICQPLMINGINLTLPYIPDQPLQPKLFSSYEF